MHEKEIWKDIPGYEGLYQVNQWGDMQACVYNNLVYYYTGVKS